MHRSAAELLVAKGATRLISWGCAAALSESLKPGDLILADKLIDAGNIEMAVNADWLGYTKKSLANFVVVHTGRLAESTSIVSSSKEKNSCIPLRVQLRWIWKVSLLPRLPGNTLYLFWPSGSLPIRLR